MNTRTQGQSMVGGESQICSTQPTLWVWWLADEILRLPCSETKPEFKKVKRNTRKGEQKTQQKGHRTGRGEQWYNNSHVCADGSAIALVVLRQMDW